ncbi:P-loop containing nucleoside triphosphate hydrolase protein [Fomes fomentarius]|nr:P-loop containing nucleoside triphosphate hydrolase protein [Fomes fomentarius]
MATSYLPQTILPTHIAPSQIRLSKLTPRTCDDLSKYILDNDPAVLGVAVRLASNGAVNAVAFATPAEVFFHTNINLKSTCGLLGLLHNPRCMLVGFGMAQIALHLYRKCGLAVHGVDLGSLYPNMKSAAEFVAGKVHQLEAAQKYRIHALWCHQQLHDVCLRAWISAICAEKAMVAIENCLKVDTDNLQDVELHVLGELLMNVELLEAEKTIQMENDFENVEVDGDGQIIIQNARFNTRVRASNQTTDGHLVVGKAVSVHGKKTGVQVVEGSFHGGGIKHIHVVGRKELTNSEVARNNFIMQLLQGISSLTQYSQFIEMLWFSSNPPPRSYISTTPCAYYNSFSKLNPSQKEVVCAMWSSYEPLVVVQGPPGTGKTTTIAAALCEWDSSWSPAWVVAQSNVGVKNIARSLVKFDINFKILVSKEFYIEWHEHLYERIRHRLIRSDKLVTDPVVVEREIGGATIILCTVAMMSNPALDAVFHLIPVERLIVDEASQIDSFEFMHLFHKSRRLKKVCMFGDPKQLPPYYKDTALNIKTIFDFKQLKSSIYFLNTQYRMPTPLGDFISVEIYNSELESVHDITDGSCLRFVDVWQGSGTSVGSSFKNYEEVDAVVSLVKNYYQHLDFCIITPYDGQRAAITQRLKAEDLPWERVYNVDSFQGAPPPTHRGFFAHRVQLHRTRGLVRHHLHRAYKEPRIPEVPQPRKCHAHPVSIGYGRCHEPKLPRQLRSRYPPLDPRTAMARVGRLVD